MVAVVEAMVAVDTPAVDTPLAGLPDLLGTLLKEARLVEARLAVLPLRGRQVAGQPRTSFREPVAAEALVNKDLTSGLRTASLFF